MDFPGIHSLLSRATGRSSCPSLSSIFPAPPVVGHGRSGPRLSEICPPPRAILSRTGWTMHGNMCVTSQKGKFLDSYIVTPDEGPRLDIPWCVRHRHRHDTCLPDASPLPVPPHTGDAAPAIDAGGRFKSRPPHRRRLAPAPAVVSRQGIDYTGQAGMPEVVARRLHLCRLSRSYNA